MEELLPTLYEMVTDGLIEVQDTDVVKIANKHQKLEVKVPRGELRRPAKMI